MRVLFAGTPDTAVPTLDALMTSDHEVVAVLTRPDAASGRGRTLRPSPVKQRASELGLPVVTASPRDPDFLAQLEPYRPDVAIVVAYGALLPPPVIEWLDYGWINLHFSLLPAWRGAAPVQRAILAGDEVSGATTFLIEQGLDTGPILGLFTETISPRDTSGGLLERLARHGAGLVVRTLDAISEGTLIPEAQPSEGISHAAKLTAADAFIDFQKPAFVVDRTVRACTPAPGAWALLSVGEDDVEPIRLGLGPVEILPDAAGQADPVKLAPGELRVTKREVVVATATGNVRLGTVKPPGKGNMPAADWARGARLTEHARFITNPDRSES